MTVANQIKLIESGEVCKKKLLSISIFSNYTLKLPNNVMFSCTKNCYYDDYWEYTKSLNCVKNIVQWYWCNECNLKCIMCHNQMEIHNNYKQDIWKEVDYSNIKLILVSGTCELFYNQIMIDELKKMFKQYPQIKIGIITNGTLLTEESIKPFLGRIQFIEVSCNAFTERIYDKVCGVRGQFNNMRYGCKVARELGIKCHYKFCTNILNYKELPEFIKWSYSLNVPVRVNSVDLLEGTNERIYDYLMSFKNNSDWPAIREESVKLIAQNKQSFGGDILEEIF
jgi:MoaA/NifB/PqqE/SkfB family radical SAM enzyme